MLHSAVFTLGLIEGGLDGLRKAVMNCVGAEGTLIVPTFSYSFRRHEIFDIVNTPCDKNVGVFAEHIRQGTAAVRSSDPMFSMAAVGAQAEARMRRSSPMCFGPGSIYERLFEEDVTFLGLGISYSTGMSGFMHLERLAEVPYRKELGLKGQCRSAAGELYDEEVFHFARDEAAWPGAVTNREPMGRILERRGVSRAVTYGHGRHFALKGRGWQDVVIEELQRDPMAMLQAAGSSQ